MTHEINTYKLEETFANSIPIKGIARMHVICSNGATTHLWLNLKHEKSDNKPQTSLGNASAESGLAKVSTLTKDTQFSQHIVKVVRGNFIVFYAIVTETSDTSRMKELDELKINYLKRSFGKQVVNGKDLDSGEIKELIRVKGHVDGSSQYHN